MYGIQTLLAGGEALDNILGGLSKEQRTFQTELSRLGAANEEAEQLKNQLQDLVTPAVSGALSQSFTDRRKSLTIFRIAWLVILLVAVGGAVWLLEFLGTDLATAFSSTKQAPSLVAIIAMRSLFLIPVLTFLGFAIAQYRKERNFEEEYAHKAAVAGSLPSYGGLVPPGSPVRDQIVTGATNAIFSSPSSKGSEESTQTDVVKAAKELIESASTLMPWKK
jgi:hypothetical protein